MIASARTVVDSFMPLVERFRPVIASGRPEVDIITTVTADDSK